MRPVQILTMTIALMSVSACGPADPDPAAAPASPAAVATPAATAEAATSEPAASEVATPEAGQACKLAAAAPRAGEAIDVDEPAIKAIIDKAGKSGVAGIEQAGTQVRARYDAWLTATIGDESAQAMDELLNAVGQVGRACTAAGVPAA
ncbi:hypothetical protein [Actinoplanes sp. HUAS TT8]|uniref:hypothetical protein n=1 Tax=Actinoplanes sp. HUAS TT8 TaxID=3447453 RepID=UPI003F5281CF